MKGLAIFVMAIAVVAASACGSGGSTGNDHAEEGDRVAKNWPAMTASDDFKEAMTRYEECMLSEGYPETDQRIGVVLKDGSIVKPEAGSRYTLSGAYLEYQISSEGCSDSSGLDAVRVQYDTADPTPNPAIQKFQNDQHVREMGCMEQKGWDIPEPQTSRGLLIFDVQFDSEEQRSAYNVEYYRCQRELGTGQFP